MTLEVQGNGNGRLGWLKATGLVLGVASTSVAAYIGQNYYTREPAALPPPALMPVLDKIEERLTVLELWKSSHTTFSAERSADFDRQHAASKQEQMMLRGELAAVRARLDVLSDRMDHLGAREIP